MKSLLALVILLCGFSVHATDWEESAKVAALFAAADVGGTFVLYDVAAQRVIGHDQARAETRFVPASTYKIPNTLIGLTVGAVANVDKILPYGGAPQPFETWSRDMSLREAIALSNVPIYQDLARRIGIERMRENLGRIGYGNNEIGSVVDRFWLDGPLRISAVEQVQFLARLAQDQLPFSPALQRNVRDIVMIESTADWKLYAKTGWQNAPDPGVGWWVGWIEKDRRIYAFALNVDIDEPADAAKRIDLGKAALKALDVM